MIHIGIINLMSDKLETEKNFNSIFTSKEVSINYLYFKSHKSKSHFDYKAHHYIPIDQYTYKNFDGFIFTGAPIDHLEFKNIDYINEFYKFINTINKHKIPTIYLCWSAMANMNFLYHVEKFPLSKKIFGIFPNQLINKNSIITGFSKEFYAPHARYYDIKLNDLNKIPDIKVLAKTTYNNPTFWINEKYNAIYSLSHIEYDPLSLVKEYMREKQAKKENIIFPKIYKDKDKILFNWKDEQKLFFTNFISIIKENKK